MPEIIKVPTFNDSRGSLTVIEKVLPFEIKRVYYIYDCSNLPRGGHRHKKTVQALVCVKGSCTIDWNDGLKKGSVSLSSPDTLLLLLPEDYHTMHSFSKDAILFVFASEYFNQNDYISEGYDDIL
jgi:dTDP-4-dehydrorhamnose 3,5-epimerase-like enzyme